MAHVEISGAEGSKLEGKGGLRGAGRDPPAVNGASSRPLPCTGGSFEGLVAMLNSALAVLQDKKPKILG